jgi:hypothetical protein
MAFVKEWPLPMAERSWQTVGRRAGKRSLFHQNLVTKNDNKKSIFQGVILLRITPFFLY